MSSSIAVHAQDVSKCYQLYARPRDRFFQSLWRRRRKLYREFWALRDVSFTIRQGEVIGIMGRNGSGKSTLLQLVCDTVQPTSGKIESYGKVTGLLELGAGFSSEFTGRENVYLNGTIMGLTRSEIDARFQRIEQFADIGGFIDQPVRTYSSGMYIRLAFATAINVDADILVIDEALAVGDELFQRKCFAKLREFMDGGKTIIFVTHSSTAVLELCSRALLLDDGELIFDGPSRATVAMYQRLLYASATDRAEVRNEIRHINRNTAQKEKFYRVIDEEVNQSVTQPRGRTFTEGTDSLKPFFVASLQPQSTTVQKNCEVEIDDFHIRTLDGERVNVLVMNEQYIYGYRVRFGVDAHNISFGMVFKTKSGLEIGWCDGLRGANIRKIRRGEEFLVEWYFWCNLMPGTYYTNGGVFTDRDGDQVFLTRVSDAMVFMVQEIPGLNYGGLVHFCQYVTVTPYKTVSAQQSIRRTKSTELGR